MREFLQAYSQVADMFGLERIVKKSIFDGYEMIIFAEGKQVIKVKTDSEEALYHYALLDLARYVKTHDVLVKGAHAKSSDKGN